MLPFAISLPLIAYLSAGLLAGALIIMGLGRITPAQAGWRWGGWRTVLQGMGWGGLLAVAGVAWLRYLIHAGSYLPIPVEAPLLDVGLFVVVAPMTEELCFRGAICGGLQRTWHPFWAVFLSATCSIVLLPVQLWLAFSFLASIGYALAFRLAGSVLASIVAHALVAGAMLAARAHPGFVSDLHYTALWYALAAAVSGILLGCVPKRQDN